MNTTKDSVAGVLFWTSIGAGEGVPAYVLFQARGRSYNFRRGCMQTHPGVLQVTAEGKLAQYESPVGAAVREALEELGSAVSFALGQIASNPEKHLIFEGNAGGRRVVTYQHFISMDGIKRIHLESSSGGLYMMNKEEVAVGTHPYNPEKVEGSGDLTNGKRGLPAMPEARAAAIELFSAIKLGKIKVPVCIDM